MTDFQSKGTGNSRYLKSVSNFLTQYPTYNDFAAALVAGTLPVDFNGINSDGINNRGTTYTKANVLSDATADEFGLDSSATVNQVLYKLGYLYGKVPTYLGICNNAGPDFAVTVANNMKPSDTDYYTTWGTTIAVYFSQSTVNTTGNITLSVNGSGAYPVRLHSSHDGENNNDRFHSAADWFAPAVVTFVFYDGCWYEAAAQNTLNMVKTTYTGSGYSKTPNFYLGGFPFIGYIYSNMNDLAFICGNTGFSFESGNSSGSWDSFNRFRLTETSENPTHSGIYYAQSSGTGGSPKNYMNVSGYQYTVCIACSHGVFEYVNRA